MKQTSLKNKVTAINIRLSDLEGLHPDVQMFVAATSDLIYAAAPDDFSESWLCYLLELHPIHVTRLNGNFYVVGGFRSYELAMLQMKQDFIVPCCLRSELSNCEIRQIALTDILGSALMCSLGPKFVQQIQNLVSRFDENVSVQCPRLASLRRIRGKK